MKMNARSPGMTLVELLVTAVVGSLVVLAIHQTLTMQERSARHQRGIITAQQNSRVALEVMTSEIREISATGGDLVDATSQSIAFRASRKFGLICQTTPAQSRIDVWERGEPFEADDSLFVFQDGASSPDLQDAWVVATVANVAEGSAGGPCPAWNVAGEALPIRQLTLSGIDVNLVARGSPVRSFTPLSYGLEKVDGEWMLGRTVDGDVFQPLVGPLVPGGVEFQYMDRNGTTFIPVTAADRRNVGRIRVTVRALAPGAVGTGQVANTLETQVFLRNR